MLHTQFRENRSAGSGDFFLPSWSVDPDFAIKISFPLFMDAPHNISL